MPQDGEANPGTIPPEKWFEIFTALTESHIGCPFYPIYGAEPLLYPGIYEVVRWLQDWGKAKYSILTNAILLNQEAKDKLLDAGLESITFSVDSLADLKLDKHISARATAAGRAVQWALQHKDQIVDIQCTSTLHRQSIGEPVYQLIEWLSERGVWWSADWYHDNKLGQGVGEQQKWGYSRALSKVVDPHPDYMLGEEDADRVSTFIHTIKQMKEQGYLIYQPNEWLDFLSEDPVSRVIKREWECLGYPAWLSIDADGKLLVCDDYQAKVAIDATELADPNRWLDFVNARTALLGNEVFKCRGCAWSTHWMSYEQLNMGDAGVEQVTHGRL